MADPLKLPSNATKAVIIEKYETLLEKYREQAARLEAAKRTQSEAEKRADAEAIEIADEASIDGVVQALGQVRSAVARAFNDLTGEMSSQAERLEVLRRGVALQEQRLEQLYGLEAGADALNKLVAAYEERRAAAEQALDARVAEVETELEERRSSLEAQIAAKEAEWAERQRERERELSSLEREREIEESEYVYQRDLARRLEEREWQESRRAAKLELDERERSIAAREQAVDALEKRIADLEKQLTTEVEATRKATTAKVTEELARKHDAVVTELAWEKKILEQRIAHLESVMAEQNKAMDALRAEVGRAQAEVSGIARQAIEGASQSASRVRRDPQSTADLT